MRVEREKRGRTEAKAQNFLRLFIKPNKLRKKKKGLATVPNPG